MERERVCEIEMERGRGREVLKKDKNRGIS